MQEPCANPENPAVEKASRRLECLNLLVKLLAWHAAREQIANQRSLEAGQTIHRPISGFPFGASIASSTSAGPIAVVESATPDTVEGRP
jgi:hypothetical protein